MPLLSPSSSASKTEEVIIQILLDATAVAWIQQLLHPIAFDTTAVASAVHLITSDATAVASDNTHLFFRKRKGDE
jgi:hypothetical protein